MASDSQQGQRGRSAMETPQNPLQGQGIAFGNAGGSARRRGAGDSGSGNGAQVSDFLNQTTFDAQRLHPFADLDKGIDYLVLADDKISDLPGGRTPVPSRGWSDDLCYGTGTTYLGGLCVGGLWGMSEALRRPLIPSAASASRVGGEGVLGKAPVSPSMRLRVNGVLNGITRRGPFVGNSAAVIAMTYNIVNSIIGHWRGKHDTLNSVCSGAISGAIFKSTKGLRPTIVGAGMVASVAAIWSAAKRAYM